MAGKILKDACDDEDLDKAFLDDLLASLLDTARASLMGKAEEDLVDWLLQTQTFSLLKMGFD